VSAASTVFLIAGADPRAPGWRVGGLTVLERKLREAARRGATRAIVACDGELSGRPIGLTIERVAAGSPPPADVEVIAADEVAGIRLGSPADLGRAESALLATLPKSFQGPIDALVNRHVSLRITRILCRTPVSPNQVTLFAVALGLLAAALLAFGGGASGALVAAGALMFFQSVFDSCDGELARLRFQFSALGQWLDNLGDDVVDAALIAALGWAAGGALAWLGLAAAGGRVFTQAALYRQVRALGGDFNDFRWWFERDLATTDQVYRRGSALTHLRSLGRRDLYIFVWAVLAILAPWWPAALDVAAGYGIGISGGYVLLTTLHLLLGRGAAGPVQVSSSRQDR
jgi:phosphatidylglycerophosphate synthase